MTGFFEQMKNGADDNKVNGWDSLNNPDAYKTLSETIDKKLPLPKPVYYIQSSEDDSVLVAINTTVERKKDGTSDIEWFDTVKQRGIHAVGTAKRGDNFMFVTRNEQNNSYVYYSMTPMTLDIYNSSVKEKLQSDRDFETEQDLIDAFMESGKW